MNFFFFFFSSRRRHTRLTCDWSSDVCSSDLQGTTYAAAGPEAADAAQRKDRDALRALVRQRADVNAPQPDGTTALHWAAHWNDAELVDLLLRAGANAKAVNR